MRIGELIGAADKDANPSPVKKKDEEQDELDLIGGTTEDDFTEAMTIIRERELLYGPNSLLAMFGGMVAEICANNILYKVLFFDSCVWDTRLTNTGSKSSSTKYTLHGETHVRFL